MMKKLTNLFLGVVACLLATTSLQAQQASITWKAVGPDNISGHSRAVLVDNQNSSKIYAGSGGGGLWVSPNGGTTWDRVSNFEAVCVSALAQDENGTLYVGTGEGINNNAYAPGIIAPFGINQYGASADQYGIKGNGVYKMVGDSFELLTATEDWKEVNRLAYDASRHILYAACDDGLQYSEDNGKTWKQAKSGNNVLNLTGIDVKAVKGVVVFADLDRSNRVSTAYVSTGGPDKFVSISGEKMIDPKAYRVELAIAPSDSNYIYASAISTQGKLLNIYLSEDMGKTFRVILPGGSTLIDMYNGGGFESNSITVFPQNAKHILVGGYPFIWEGNDIQENTFYSFSKLTANYGTHTIAFDPKNNDIAYLATDMGIAKTTFIDETMASYSMKRKNFASAQMTSLAVANNGALLGGSVSNGSLYISTQSNTEQTASSLTGTGYAGPAMFSMLNTNALFYATTYGQCYRQASTTSDPVDAGSWYGSDMVSTYGASKYPNWSYTIQRGNTKAHATLSPMVMWESTNDPNATEQVTFKADKRYDIGDSICVKSKTANYPMWMLAPKDMDTDDSTRDKSCNVIDHVQNRVFIGGGGYNASGKVYGAPIYMGKGALEFATPPTWYRIFFTVDTNEQVTNLCVSEDGNHLFASTFSSKTGYHNVYRFSGFNTNRDSATLSFGTSQGKVIDMNPSYGLDYAKIYSTNIDFITSIYVNPYNNDELIITFSNNEIMATTNATKATHDSELVVNSKLGDGIPSDAAIYTAVVLKCDGEAFTSVNADMAMVGTEEGVYYTENFTSNSPEWKLANLGIDSKVPVIKLIQQRNSAVDLESHYYSKSYVNDSAIIDTTILYFEGVKNHGCVYAATYGRGIFRTDAFARKDLNVAEKAQVAKAEGLLIYPNPTSSQATVSFELKNDAQVSIAIYDISGRQISNRQLGRRLAGNNETVLNCSNMPMGIYFVQVKAGVQTMNGKIVITK